MMVLGSGSQTVTPFSRCGVRPVADAEPAVLDRFQRWSGRSGRSYMTSVFPVRRGERSEPLPDFGPAVLFAVARRGGRRVVLAVRAVEREEDWAGTMAALRACADEWHVHLLARDRAERSAVAADFSQTSYAQVA
jgi:hypothetical protein